MAVALCAIAATHSLADWNSTIAASNPLNWYRLDETGPIAIDYGSEGLDGTYGTGVHAPTQGVPGRVGTAASFDGDQDNILLHGGDIAGDWTAEFIVMRTGTRTSAELLRGEPFASPSSHLKLEQYPNTGQVGYTQSFVADHVFSPGYTTPLDEFVHLVYVKTATEMKLYADGVLKGTNASTISLPRYQFGDAMAESPLAVVDEIVVYDRALSPGEIAGHFNAIPEPSTLILAASGLAAAAIWALCKRR
ncbi:MAG: PEP-CTERM sorting domain-containing protein [Planctomycetota bacterium]|nr:MAG: PEP-CTERM sorting domain-containing protein [Planctomycetota bacterium]